MATRFIGLRPSTWICVGAGYSREDVKAAMLADGRGFVGQAVAGLDELCLRIVNAAGLGGPHEKPVLPTLARQEILRTILLDSRLRNRFGELKRLKRQGGFWRRLDRALERGRLAFAHAEEEAVFEERLRARTGAPRPVREELRVLAGAYEAWLRAEKFWDVPLLLEVATEVLETGWPPGLHLPEGVLHYSTERSESREQSFWDALGRHLAYRRVGCPIDANAAEGLALAEPLEVDLAWERWHTIDDAVERLASEIHGRAPEELRSTAVLIPDDAAVRRSLQRALANWAIPLGDPRDPTRNRWDEGLKRALEPLELVALGFPRERVVAWLQDGDLGEVVSAHGAWVVEIQKRGIRGGLAAYAGGKLTGLHSELTELASRLGGRRTCAELGQAHLQWLAEKSRHRDMRPFFEAIWLKFAEDLGRLGEEASRQSRPPLFWLERLRERLAQTPPPLERERPVQGLDVYRLHQGVPPGKPRLARVTLLGATADWLTSESLGDDWFSEREREILSGEFAVRSGIQSSRERMASLREWCAHADRVEVLEAEYDFDGRERESVESLLAELGLPLPETPFVRGAHPRWRKSFLADRAAPRIEAPLSPLPSRPDGSPPVLSATALDHYSRCGFIALAYDRWRLNDLEEPGTELWPNVRGNLLHSAVRILTQNRDSEGGFTVSVEDALTRAWRESPPEGVLRGPAVENLIRSRLLVTLRAFAEKERDYIRRSGARTIAFDDRRFSLTLGCAEVTGKPDRIDENENGFFIIDYKAGGGLPHGDDMVNLGYRLQLPFYALASQRELAKPVLGLQFVELNRGAGRTRGIFFKPYNGKEAGRFTNATARSRSLLAVEPADAWARLGEHLEANARGLVAGEFSARPTKPEECQGCRMSDLCGLRRRPAPNSAEGGGDGP